MQLRERASARSPTTSTNWGDVMGVEHVRIGSDFAGGSVLRVMRGGEAVAVSAESLNRRSRR